MSTVNGQLMTCNRCGKTVFKKAIKEKDIDGGYTRWTVFEEAKGWTYENFIGELCPECSLEYELLKKEFKNKQEAFKEKV